MIRAIVKATSSLTADLKEVSHKKTKPKDAKLHDTKFYFEQEWHDAVIYDRGKLGVGTVITGPAIIVEMDSTTLVLPGHAATVDAVGNLLINPSK
jgi:N-methylhydantoinase A